ncbi:hypothetical protein [Croceivirga thetidis]|uniref:tRNA nuclease CdiA C-terminal domain-containing protein n=1 Tax=Croceivirga thetidis TaxID=2721623 RepID=A0ABX1GLN2_9FLAO|nr:hypothetical protein [Croceivirga thetidis]NKI30774.1 hypothetical protein [Croceivirga thetidis]
MKDSEFKGKAHSANGYEIFLKGGELFKGYKPDFVLRKNNSFIILESEHGTSRKHFLGGMIKASKYLVGKKKGTLVFVIKLKNNTTEENIALHLKPYLEWIRPLTNLRDVYVISDMKYCASEMPIRILEDEFKNSSLKV